MVPKPREGNDRQVFWLSALTACRRLPKCVWHSVASAGSLTDYSGGPATDLHRFTYCPPRLAEAPVNETVLPICTASSTTRRAIPGESRFGFSPAACTAGRELYVSTGDGKVSRLSVKGDSWDEVGTLKQPRIVHRLVPMSDHSVMALGGSVEGTSVATVEVVSVASPPKRK